MYSDFNKVINFLVFSIFLSFSAVSRADTEKIPLIIDYISYELIENQVGVVEIQQLPGEGEFSVNWQFTSNYSTYVLEEYPLYSSSSTWAELYSGTAKTHNLIKKSDGDYRYRIKGCNGEVCSDYLFIEGFNVDIPVHLPTGVVALVEGDKHTINWQASYRADTFQLEFAINAGDWQPVTITSEKQYSHSVTIGAGVKYRVKACNTADNKCSDWSESSNIVNSPVVHEPTSNIAAELVDKEYHISWQPVAGVASYQVAMQYNDGNWFDLTSVDNSSATLNYPMLAAGSYRFRVYACYRQFEVTECSEPSESSQLITVTNEQVIPRSVIASKIYAPHYEHVIEWGHVSSAEELKYSLEVSTKSVTSGTWSNWGEFMRTPDTSFSHQAPHLVPYRYRVNACFLIDGNKVCGDWSAPSNTIVGSGGEGVPNNIVVVRTDGTNYLTWEKVEKATNYQLQLSRDENPWENMTTTPALDFNSAPKISGNYRYRVQGLIEYNGQELETGWSDPSNEVEVILPIAISGAPTTEIDVDTSFYFKPIVTTEDKGALVFNIKNQPSWAQFNVVTGELSGTPTADDAGIYPEIEISVAHAKAAAVLTPFSIKVKGENSRKIEKIQTELIGLPVSGS